MRRLFAIAAFAFLTACGSTIPTDGTSPPPPPPPPPAPGAPASIAVVTGDGQSAAPGTVLPVKLSVLVKDAAGVAVPGVVVHFAIDSGGGSLSTSAVTTLTDGTASGVTWTLGAAGSNVVAVTVNSLAPLRIHAQAFGAIARTIFNNTSVGSAGGTFTYTKAGDALSGLSVTVKPGAFQTSTSWSIVADTTLAVPLPSGFTQVGPTLVINTGQGFADSIMTLTMPMHLTDKIAVAPFYFDPATGTLEAIPLVGRTATSATLATQHFSADLMAIPGAGAVGSLRASLRQGFGAVQLVWVEADVDDLTGTFSTSFAPGKDDWEFINYGDFVDPGGDCAGMSITAMYYHYFFRLGSSPKAPLYHKYDQSIPNQWDNVQGIRFAGSVQGDVISSWTAGVDAVSRLENQSVAEGVAVSSLTTTWIVLSLKLTHHPILMYLKGGSGGAHAVVAYSVTSAQYHVVVSVADPNRPANQGVTLTYDFGDLQPINFADNASASPQVYTQGIPLGVSSMLSMQKLGSRWAEFAQQKAGQDRYPKHYRVDIQNQFDLSWSQLPADVISYSQNIVLRTVCTDCMNNPADSVQQVTVWDGDGTTQIANSTFGRLPGPARAFTAVAYAARNNQAAAGFVDAVPFSAVYQQVTITGPAQWDPNAPITFTVQNPPNVAGAHYQFVWDFGDGSALGVANDNPDMTHTYAVIGSRTVVVAITDLATGHIIARAGLSSFVATPDPVLDLTVAGNWPNNTAPALGNYHYTDLHGSRAANPAAGIDALLIDFDPYTADNVSFNFGVTLIVVIPAGSALHAGQTFTKWVSGPGGAGPGQFQLAVSADLAHPENGTIPAPGNSGLFTITSVVTLPDGATAINFSFSVSNGIGGTISGSGTWGYR